MKRPRSKPESAKLSVSLSKTVYGWAVELAEKKGFDTNFSAYIADLIRRDQERDAEKKCGGAVGGTVLGVGSAPTELNEPVSYKTRKP